MKPVLIWDLPTRLFHWLLAACCIAAFTLALCTSEHSRAFDSHMLFGLALIPLVVFRLFWGFVGTTYARFRTCIHSPGEAVGYLFGMITHTARRYLGHNPAASYAILAMFILVPCCIVSGLLIQSSKFFQELHEIISYILMVIIGAHLIGVVVHTVAHKENVALSMLTGTKMAQTDEGITSSHALVALCMLVLTGIWTGAVVKQYDFTTRRMTMPLIGTVIQFGKNVQDDGNYHGDDND